MKFLLLSLLLAFSFSTAQTIKGTVSDQNGTVPFVSVLLRNAENPETVVQFATTDENGRYAIEVGRKFPNVIIEVQSMAHEPEKITISEMGKSDLPKTVNFILKDRITGLKEVIIVKEKPIRIKNDTTVYNAKAFKDGSERVVEDLLRKLPGIKVAENGEISYKGKPIKKLLLEGDDLFNSNYTIGSKNINVDMVEQVEAIDKYEENPLLKGLTASDDVALNLRLKKNQSDYSGNIEYGYGFDEKHKAASSLLGISSNLKSFAVLSYNNIGSNSSPYNFQSAVATPDALSDEKYRAKEILSQNIFFSGLEDKYQNINHNFYSTINSLYRFREKTTARINFGIYDDRLEGENQVFSQYNGPGVNFNTFESESVIKKPRLYDVNVLVSHTFRDSLLVEYIGKVNTGFTTIEKNINGNSGLFSNTIHSKNLFLKQNLNWVKRFDVKSALTGNVVFAFNSAPQSFSLTPGFNLDDYSYDNASKNHQESHFSKQSIDARISYLRKDGKLTWKTIGQYNYVRNTFDSSLTQEFIDTVVSDENFRNNLSYTVSIPLWHNVIMYETPKFGFKLGVKAAYYSFSINDRTRNVSTTGQKLVLSPNLRYLRKITAKATADFSYDYNQVAPDEKNVFAGFVLTDYRSFSNNIQSLGFLKRHEFKLSYSYDDLFSFTHLNGYLSYQLRQNNFQHNNTLNPVFNVTTSYLSDAANRNYNAGFTVEKLLYFMRTNLKLNSNYSLGFSNNTVNGSALRKVKNQNLMADLTLIPSLKSEYFYFENKIITMVSDYAVAGENNNIVGIKDAAKLVFKMKERFKANAVMNYMAADISKDDRYLFLDVEASLVSKNKKINYSLIARDLTNNDVLITSSASDYLETNASQRLIGRFLMFVVNFNF